MKEQCLEIVRQKCNGCKGCALASARKNIVFGSGNANTAKSFLLVKPLEKWKMKAECRL